MAESKRTARDQTDHDVEVARLARAYDRDGYEVQADVAGYPKPDLVFGKRPDLIVTRPLQIDHQTLTERVIVEVETEATRDDDHAEEQAAAFQKAQAHWPWTTFRLVVIP